MTRARLAGMVSLAIVLVCSAVLAVVLVVSLNNMMSPPLRIYEGPSIPSKYSYMFDRFGIPPTAAGVRLYYDPSLRGGYWLSAKFTPDEAAMLHDD